MLDDWMLDAFKLDSGIAYAEVQVASSPQADGAAWLAKYGTGSAASASSASAVGLKQANAVAVSESAPLATGGAHLFVNANSIALAHPSCAALGNMLLAARGASESVSSVIANSILVVNAAATAGSASDASAIGAKLPLDASEFVVHLVEEVRLIALARDVQMTIPDDALEMAITT